MEVSQIWWALAPLPGQRPVLSRGGERGYDMFVQGSGQRGAKKLHLSAVTDVII
jgi:hypothetical protein